MQELLKTLNRIGGISVVLFKIPEREPWRKMVVIAEAPPLVDRRAYLRLKIQWDWKCGQALRNSIIVAIPK